MSEVNVTRMGCELGYYRVRGVCAGVLLGCSEGDTGVLCGPGYC